MKLNTSWLVFAGASIVWGAVISDDLFANAPKERIEMEQPHGPAQCADHSAARKTHTAAGSS